MGCVGGICLIMCAADVLYTHQFSSNNQEETPNYGRLGAPGSRGPRVFRVEPPTWSLKLNVGFASWVLKGWKICWGFTSNINRRNATVSMLQSYLQAAFQVWSWSVAWVLNIRLKPQTKTSSTHVKMTLMKLDGLNQTSNVQVSLVYSRWTLV